MTSSHASTTMSAGFVSSDGFLPAARRTMQATIAMQNANPAISVPTRSTYSVVVALGDVEPQVHLHRIARRGHHHDGHAHVHPEVRDADARSFTTVTCKSASTNAPFKRSSGRSPRSSGRPIFHRR